ncbi:MAG: hypothetical protein KY455_00675 [Euryarchaeota archaeon]|nr:hypothetical protein [Euryarchaeota archaeon]
MRLEVLTTINFTAPLPTDGSTFTYDFTTFCCPGSTRIYVVPTDALGPQQRWDVRVVVQETGQVVMSDLNGNGWGAGPYEQALGSSFLEEFQLQVVPQGGLPPLGEASVSVEIGQWKFS